MVDFEEEDSTKVVVMKMAKSRRKGAMIIAAVAVVAGALIAVWVATSAKSCLAERAELESNFGGGPIGGSPPGLMDPTAIDATVYIFLSTKGSISVDGFPTAKGVTRLKTKMDPGPHRIRAELKKSSIEQALIAKAGEGFLVDFDDNQRSVSIKRLYNIK